MSEEIKMSKWFSEKLTLCGDTIEDSNFSYAVMSCEYLVDGVDSGIAMCHAINNHDRIVEENKRLRDALRDSHAWLGIDADYTESPLQQSNEKLLSELGGDK